MAQVSLGRFSQTEAQLLRLELESQGIEVSLVGENRSTLQGAIPAAETEVEVLVSAEDLERAQLLLAAVQRERVATAPPAVRARPPVFTLFFAVTTIILGVLLFNEKRLAAGAQRGPIVWTNDGPCVMAIIQGKKASASCDRNDDGNYEEMEAFDIEGRSTSKSLDADENGRIEKVEEFDVRGVLLARYLDANQDGHFDIIEIFDTRGESRVRYFDSNSDGRLDRREGVGGLMPDEP